MNKETQRRAKQQRDRTALITKAGLAVVFLFGVILIFMGIRAQKNFASSGFSSESAYQAIYALGYDVSGAWQKKLMPELEKFPEADRSVLDEVVKGLLAEAWKSQSSSAELPDEAAADRDRQRETGHHKTLEALACRRGQELRAYTQKIHQQHGDQKIRQRVAGEVRKRNRVFRIREIDDVRESCSIG